ncbi:MAG: pilus assembly protein N-terminal domain-containing protein [Pseudomonadota bacterium]
MFVRRLPHFVLPLVAAISATALTHTMGDFSSAEAMQIDKKQAIVVTIDRAKVLKISRPADTVIVGNPSIADATIQDAQTLVLTGRSFGVTNLIIIDGDGNPIIDETIVVQGHENNTVRIYRRSVRETLACSPVCEPTLTIGDNNDTFTNANDQIKKRNLLSDQSAQGNTPNAPRP